MKRFSAMKSIESDECIVASSSARESVQNALMDTTASPKLKRLEQSEQDNLVNIVALECKVRELTIQLSSIESKHVHSESKYEKRIQALQQEIESLMHTERTYSSEIASLRNENTKMKQNMVEQARMSLVDESNVDLVQHAERQSSAFTELQQGIASLQVENAVLTKQNQEMMLMNERLQQVIVNAQTKISGLEQVIAQQNDMILSLQDQIESMSQERQEVTQPIPSMHTLSQETSDADIETSLGLYINPYLNHSPTKAFFERSLIQSILNSDQQQQASLIRSNSSLVTPAIEIESEDSVIGHFVSKLYRLFIPETNHQSTLN